MTASCVKPGAALRLALVAAVAGCCLSGQALAQGVGAPVQLFPPPAAPSGGAPSAGGAAGPAPAVPSPQVPGSQPRLRGDGAIAVEGLRATSSDSIGVLDARQGGLPAQMWQGTAYRVAVRALESLPADVRSPARRELARRLLASAAAPPAGGTESVLLGLRVSKLLDMGATADVRALVQAAPADAAAGPQGEALARALVDSLLIDGLSDQACATAQQGLGRFDSLYWQKVMVYCGLRGGARDQAGLQLSMLRDQGVDDPLFLWAAEQMSGLRPKQPSGFPNPSPLVMAMLRDMGGKGLPSQTVSADAAPWLLRAVAVAETKGGDPVLRVAAAEYGLQAGALSAEEAATAFSALPTGEVELARPAEALAKDRSVRGAAVLYQAAIKREDPGARAEVVAAALAEAQARGVYLAAAHLYAPLIQVIPPAPDLGWFARPAGRALYATGRFEAARKWSAMVGALVASGVQNGQATATLLWPLDRLATERGGGGPLPMDRLTAWRGTAARPGDGSPVPTADSLARAEARLLVLLKASGDQVPQEAWSSLWGASGGEARPVPVALSQGLMDAALGGRMAETAALALALLGDARPANLADSALADAVDALTRVGLGGYARGIAVEAAVSAGL